MRVSLSWLDEWTPCRQLPVEELAERLIHRGFPVEEIQRVGGAWEGIVVGEVLEVAKHPKADRLVLCRVNAGTGETLSIVCGATNVSAGMRVPVALPGSVLPDGLEIRKSKIRGEVSQGMLCSSRELALGDDHAGILGLAADAPVGRPLAEAIERREDVILDLEIHYNRPDLLSVAGVARELAAAIGTELRSDARPRLERSIERGGDFPIALEDAEGCPRYVGAVLRDVKIDPSPAWLVERLEAAGLRPLYNVVDVTNYVLLELGQPLHAFDLARLAGPEIRVRRAGPGERLRTLDGRDRVLGPENLVIADRERPVALAGVMGGEESEVTEGTRDILLESAYFEPFRIQVTANALKLMSEASRRFARGVDPNLAPVAAARAVELLEEIGAARFEGPASESAARTFEPLELTLEPERANALLGIEIEAREMRTHLEDLDFTVTAERPLQVTVPTYRGDVREPTDLIEEIGRAYGLERLPEVSVGGGAAGARMSADWQAMQEVRRALVGLGFDEALTPSLGDPDKLAATWPLTHLAEREPRFVRLVNPPAPEAGVLRTDLAAGLLEVVDRHLRHGAPGTRVFEVGRVFVASAPENGDRAGVEESVQVAFAIAGSANPESWEGEREVDFYDAKGLAESLLERLRVDSVVARPYASPAWKSGESAELHASSHVGWVGRLDPRQSRPWKLERPVFLFLASLAALVSARRAVGPFQPFSRFPGVKRDLAFFLPSHVPHAAVEARMRQAAGKLLRAARLFDVYRGKGVPDGQKSLAYGLLFAHPERTLKESEVEALQESIVQALATEWGATLRDRAPSG